VLFELAYLTVALLLSLLLLAAGASMIRARRLVEQLPPLLLTGFAGTAVFLVIGPIWNVAWLTDIAVVIAAATVVVTAGILKREDGERRREHA